MATLRHVMSQAQQLWPAELAEEWDSIGLVCGDPAQEVDTILFCVDPTHAVIDEALAHHAQLIIAHHPLYLQGVSGVGADTYKGSIVHRLIQNGIALYTAHTNADSAANGVSEQLIELCGVENSEPLVPSAVNPHLGLGRVGDLPEPVTLAQFSQHLADELPVRVGGIRVAGDNTKEIKRVAVCGGAGDSLFDAVKASAADVYVTSDLRHHPALEATQNSTVALIDTAHSASEGIWLPAAAEEFAQLGYTSFVSTENSDPWDTLIVQSGE
ncbi:MAG: Nif3-like dinuclear metal center hexameric protein [Micrococcaceae bacterium]